MIRQILLGTAVALMIAGPASALTMTPTEDNRLTQASAMAGADSDFDDDFPSPDYSNFDSTVSAMAMEFGLPGLQLGDAEYFGFGASSYASADQLSQVGPLSISGSGSASASGNHGDELIFRTLVEGDALIAQGGSFRAYGQSVLEIIFSIDEAAEFDLYAFLSAGQGQVAIGAVGNDVINHASISLVNTGTLESAYKAEISDDTLHVDTSGVIGPGTYKFSVEAYAEVLGLGGLQEPFGDVDIEPILLGYETDARFSGVSLELSAIDQPIPEPVTTSLVGLSLGALALQISRRRRA